MMDSQNDNTKGSWREWANYVLLTISSQKREIDELKKDISNLNGKLKVLLTKIGFIVGIGASVITVLVSILLKLLFDI